MIHEDDISKMKWDVGVATCSCGAMEVVPAMNSVDFEVHLVNSTLPICA